jgi:hypothetical protein
MNKLTMAIAVAVVAGSIAVCVAIQRQTTAAIQERTKSVAEQKEALASLSADNERVSEILDNLKNTQPLNHDQLLELARLRSHVGQIRQIVAAAPRIQATNAQLHQIQAERQKHLAEAQALPNYWPKDQLAFAGYATPDDTLKSLLWTMQTGNINSWQSNCTPEAAASLEQEWKKHGLTPEQQEAQLKAMAAGFMGGSSGFHIVNEETPTPGQAVIDLSFDGEDTVRTFVLKQSGGGWKFSDVVFKGQPRPGK